LSVGGDGYDENPTETTKFLFPECPSGPDAWAMTNVDLEYVSSSLSSFKYGDFPAGKK